jgi:hypothetical protein
MDPVTVVVSALAAGAATGLNDAVAAAVKDAYTALKGLLARRYRTIDVAPVERKPDSEAKRKSLEEDLADAGADSDTELLDAARRLIEQVQTHTPTAGPAIGVDLERVKAEALRLRKIHVAGKGDIGARVRDSEFRGDIDVGEVQVGDEARGRP